MVEVLNLNLLFQEDTIIFRLNRGLSIAILVESVNVSALLTRLIDSEVFLEAICLTGTGLDSSTHPRQIPICQLWPSKYLNKIICIFFDKVLNN